MKISTFAYTMEYKLKNWGIGNNGLGYFEATMALHEIGGLFINEI